MKLSSYFIICTIGFSGLSLAQNENEAKSLAQKLEERASQSNPKITPEIRKAFKEGLEAIDESDVVSKAKQVGDTAPDFTLINANGQSITLSNELKKGPVILTWYRGGW